MTLRIIKWKRRFRPIQLPEMPRIPKLPIEVPTPKRPRIPKPPVKTPVKLEIPNTPKVPIDDDMYYDEDYQDFDENYQDLDEDQGYNERYKYKKKRDKYREKRHYERHYERYEEDQEEEEEEEEMEEWMDLYERLYQERVIMLFGQFDTSRASDVISLLLFFGIEDDDIMFFINSCGGEARSGIGICDTIQALMPDVWTYVMGLAASIASLILSEGTDTKRVAFPNARVMIRQPVTDHFSAFPERLKLEAEEMLELRNTIADMYAQNTRKPFNVIQQDLEREKYMSAKEAKDYGIVDCIVKETFR